MSSDRCVIAICSVALILAGCATASKDITSTYVSPNQYNAYDCDQLTAEAGRIQTRVVQLGGRLDQAAQNDAGIMAVGIILFWPVLFALGGTKQQEAEYARLKGEYDAVEQAAIAKKCTTAIRSTTATANNPATPVSPQAPAMQAAQAAPLPAAAIVVQAAPAAPSIQQVTLAKAESPVATPPPISAPPAAGVSRFLFNAERFAKDNGCPGAAAVLTIRTATSETFAVTCASGDPLSIRCDDGVCRELR